MRNLFIIINLVTFILTKSLITSYANNIDIGNVKRVQPDGTYFFAKEYGDEVAMNFETMDGYQYFVDNKTGFYYYAILGTDRNFIKSQYKVGIDNPVSCGIVKGLKRTDEAQRKIDEARNKYSNPDT